MADLMDPAKGYVVNDCMEIEVAVVVHIPEPLFRDKEKANLYTTVTIVRDADIKEQIGTDIFFDLINHDKVQFTIRNSYLWPELASKNHLRIEIKAVNKRGRVEGVGYAGPLVLCRAEACPYIRPYSHPTHQ